MSTKIQKTELLKVTNDTARHGQVVQAYKLVKERVWVSAYRVAKAKVWVTVNRIVWAYNPYEQS